MKIIYSNMDDEKAKEDMLTLLQLRQRLYVDVIAGEKGNYGHYVIGMVLRILYSCFFLAISLFSFAMFIMLFFDPERALGFFTLFCSAAPYTFFRFCRILGYPDDMTWDAITDECFREDLYWSNHRWKKGYYKRNDIRGPKSFYGKNHLCNRFHFGNIDSYLEYNLRSVLNELYYTAMVIKWMRYIAKKSNAIQKLLEENNGDVCVTVEKIDYDCSDDRKCKEIEGNFSAWDRHKAYERLDLKGNLRFGYLITVSIKDRVKTSEDRVNLVFKTQSQCQMYLDEYEYRQIFRTEGVMDLSFADQKCIEMNESIEKAKRFVYEKLGEPMVPLLCDKQAAE